MGLFDFNSTPSISKLAQKNVVAQGINTPLTIDYREQFDPQFAELSLANIGRYLGGQGGEPGLPTMLARGATAGRAETLGGFASLGPSILSGFQASDPITARILNTQAQEELALGAELDPGIRREVRQGVRGGQAARGMGFGPTDVYEEAFNLGSAGQQIRQDRRNFASGVAGLSDSTLGSFSRGILGMGQESLPFLSAQYQHGLGSQPTYNPFDPVVSGASLTRQQLDNAENSEKAGFYSDLIGGALSAVGTIGAAAAGAAFV
jgi:hypothetical protein